MYIIYRVNEFDTIESIAKKFGVTEQNISNKNLTKKIQEGDRIVIDKTPQLVHVVMPGESIESIAKLYNVSKDYLIKKNGINKIFNGLNLFI